MGTPEFLNNASPGKVHISIHTMYILSLSFLNFFKPKIKLYQQVNNQWQR